MEGKRGGGDAYMLVDQDNGNVLALLCEAVECAFDGRGFRLGIDYQVVLLAVWGVCDVLWDWSASVVQRVWGRIGGIRRVLVVRW